MVFVLLENYIYFSGQCVCYAYCYVRICGEVCRLFSVELRHQSMYV